MSSVAQLPIQSFLVEAVASLATLAADKAMKVYVYLESGMADMEKAQLLIASSQAPTGTYVPKLPKVPGLM